MASDTALQLFADEWKKGFSFGRELLQVAQICCLMK